MMLMKKRRSVKRNRLRSSRRFQNEKHGDDFACDGYGEIEESCHYHSDDEGRVGDHLKCCPLLLNGCYFRKITQVLRSHWIL